MTAVKIPFIKSPVLKTLPGIAHGFFGRQGGVSTGDFDSLNVGLKGDSAANVEENRARIAQTLKFQAQQLVLTNQIHGSVCNIVEDPQAIYEGDALVTQTTGILLGIQTADCAPVLFVDTKSPLIGIAHAGWRGATSGILQNTVDTMMSLGAEPENIYAAIGPCIGAPNYTVGADVFEAANMPDVFTPHETETENDKYNFNLSQYVENILRNLGLMRVSPSPFDTFKEEDKFFSHRRMTLSQAHTTGGQLSVIGLL